MPASRSATTAAHGDRGSISRQPRRRRLGLGRDRRRVLGVEEELPREVRRLDDVPVDDRDAARSPRAPRSPPPPRPRRPRRRTRSRSARCAPGPRRRCRERGSDREWRPASVIAAASEQRPRVLRAPSPAPSRPPASARSPRPAPCPRAAAPRRRSGRAPRASRRGSAGRASAAICGTCVTQRTWSLAASVAQLPADDLRHPPADPGVHLVEDERAAAAAPGRRRPTGSRAGAARARRPRRSSRAASPARPGLGAKRNAARLEPGGARAPRRPRSASATRSRAFSIARPCELLLDGRREPAGAASRRRADRRRRRRGDTPLAPRRASSRAALERVLDVRELGRARAFSVGQAREDLGDRRAVLALEPRDLARGASRSRSAASGSASIAPAASRAAAARSAIAALELLRLVPVRGSRGSIAASSANARAASPRRSAAEPSSSESARRAASPALPDPVGVEEPVALGRQLLLLAPRSGATDSISRIWNSSISSRSLRARAGSASSASSRSRASRPRAPRPPRPPPAPPRGLREGVERARAAAPASASSCSELCPWIATSALADARERPHRRRLVLDERPPRPSGRRARGAGAAVSPSGRPASRGARAPPRRRRTRRPPSAGPRPAGSGSAEPRPPASSASASTRIDLPAPVSPVIDRQAPPSSSSRSSTIARFLTVSRRSTREVYRSVGRHRLAAGLELFALFCAICLAGMPPTIQPGSTGLDATPIEPDDRVLAPTFTPESTTEWYVMRARSPISVLCER